LQLVQQPISKQKRLVGYKTGTKADQTNQTVSGRLQNFGAVMIRKRINYNRGVDLMRTGSILIKQHN
jgi:hypothetical protein